MLAQYDATMENVVDEMILVINIEVALAALPKVSPEFHPGAPGAANTLVQISRLAFPEAMIEIRCVAKV